MRRGVGMRAARTVLLAAAATRSLLSAATFTVTSTADSGPGTLRQAILDANASPAPNLIAFAVNGGGLATIAPTSALPPLAQAVTIDGTTQPGFAGTPIVALDGSQAGIGVDGLDENAGNSVIRGLSIGGFGAYGIALSGTAAPSAVEGCYVGLDASGVGIRGNHLAGIAVLAGAHRIGGALPEQRNVIAGQTIGIYAASPDPGTLIAGNWIGLRADGSPASDSLGIDLRSPAALIGGTAAGAGNVVSGHVGDAINLSAGADGTVLQGNFVGTDPTGTFAVPNSGTGISVAGANGVMVGGISAGGNVISGNRGNAVAILGQNNSLFGNLIGTDVSGAAPLPNGGGVLVVNSTATTIGGTTAGDANVIAFNSGSGVVVDGGSGNSIRGNSIFGNGLLGIDLLPPDVVAGHTPNDDGDVDEGGNGLQNFPLLLAVDDTPGGLHIQGVLHSAPAASYWIDFYADAACSRRPRTLPQARVWLGGAFVTTTGGDRPDHEGGDAPFDVFFTVQLAAGDVVTATATDAAGNTSEISSGIVFDVLPRSGAAAGGEAVAIVGTDFAPDAAVSIGGVAVSRVLVDAQTIAAVSPALPPGTAATVSVASASGPSGALPFAWFADFTDVPADSPFHDAVVAAASNGVAAGCGGGAFCPSAAVTRAQAAPLLLRARDGSCVPPPPCTGVFEDVPCPGPFADWIEALAAAGITAGCGGGAYCPDEAVRRDQAAPLVLRSALGSDYVPPRCAGVFTDVLCPGPFTDWIEDLAARGIAAGCGGGAYCPDASVTRAQMAALLANAFALP
ncbi:MAG TPA: S-layer homology domain-containing protein [Thermoanaerobaculia bacterium]|nr:S-layer homology domain-containing protein [Thermoanaerobaculia bacterium]